MFRIDFRWLFTLFLFLPILGHAEDSSSGWELGIGFSGGTIPHYRGSNQALNFLFPVPLFQYEGKRLKVNREGGRFYLYQGKRFWFDVDLSADSLPLISNDDRSRQGMPDLLAVIEVGPRAVVDLYQSADDNLRIRAVLPLRMAIATDLLHNRDVGRVFSPYLQIRYYTGWESSLSIGPTYATEAFHDYYYQVDPLYATPARPAYDAKAGYSGFRFTLTTTHRFKHNYVLGVGMRYDLLGGAVFADSPLVKQKDSFLFAVAFGWMYDI